MHLHSNGAEVSGRLISGVSHLHFSFLPLQLPAERSRQQIQGTDIWTDSLSGQFSTVAGSNSSLPGKILMLLVSHFTSSGQRAKLIVLGCLPSLLCLFCFFYCSVIFYRSLILHFGLSASVRTVSSKMLLLSVVSC